MRLMNNGKFYAGDGKMYNSILEWFTEDHKGQEKPESVPKADDNTKFTREQRIEMAKILILGVKK